MPGRKPKPTTVVPSAVKEVKIGSNFYVSREMKIAYDNATVETGMLRNQILTEALRDWLIAHGYLDAYRGIAL